ncbi:MAG: prepilin-type N-terminal cleavage/methylation domain-containing protein [Candidatus Sumerlaeia bacterium]|nr:prepilin-type N-terminal cleavage/methylation domain-containing protein [Candidatus Sumerlaeia bacterium]
MPANYHPRAFTLVELLIVVAIIAILAAIAVPNFLEAQVRAKVSRARSDQRALATALEAYRVDNAAYPPQGPKTQSTYPYVTDDTRIYGGDSPRHAAGNPTILFHLSTPVAYITSSALPDPFFKGFNLGGTSIANDVRWYNYSGDYFGGRTYQPSTDGTVEQFEATSRALQQKTGWHLRSRGPDGLFATRTEGNSDFLLYHGQAGAGPTGNGGINVLYDPTNGTASRGDLYRLGLGRVPGQ